MKKLSNIITLTTDLGVKDPYLPSVKGRILSEFQDANIRDISHEVTPFDISEAAFLLKNCYKDYPEGTIHLVGVDTGSGYSQGLLVANFNEHIFLAGDNGILSLLEEDPPDWCYRIEVTEKERGSFMLRDYLVPAACKLLKGSKPEVLGKPEIDMQVRKHLHPVVQDQLIRGTVIYIDRFGNAITNIRKKDLLRFRQFKEMRVHYSRTEYFDKIGSAYDEVPEGEGICLFGYTGFLEVAINRGNASGLLGIDAGHLILIEFE